MKIKFFYTKEFEKEFKKLSKKYLSLGDDINVLKEVILSYPKGNGTKHWNLLKIDDNEEKYIFKMRLRCKSTKSSDFRIIYFYNGENIEILFIEIYFKGNKGNDNRKRIEEFWEKKTKHSKI